VGNGDQFQYLVQPWVLSLFLDCPTGMGLRCPGPAARDAVRAAAASGALTWHAAPFNLEWEVMDAGMIRAAVEMVHALDDELGQPHKITVSLVGGLGGGGTRHTLPAEHFDVLALTTADCLPRTDRLSPAWVQRDVPGLTRAAVPLLAASGVRALSVGVNWGSAPPGVPKSEPFIWRDEASGTELIAMWHEGEGACGHLQPMVPSQQSGAPDFRSHTRPQFSPYQRLWAQVHCHSSVLFVVRCVICSSFFALRCMDPLSHDACILRALHTGIGGYGGWSQGRDIGSPRDCVHLKGFNHVLCYAWRCDNGGTWTVSLRRLVSFAVIDPTCSSEHTEIREDLNPLCKRIGCTQFRSLAFP